VQINPLVCAYIEVIKVSWKKSMFVYAAVLALVVGSITFIVMVVKDRTYVPSRVYEPAGELNRAVAVVYYSRSGHSEAVAREIAQTFNAPIAVYMLNILSI
jgi:hypothetical protein